MKKSIIIIIFIIVITVILIPDTSAHTIGQPPFFKINGQYANLYPVPLASLYNFDLPQDIASPANFLVNENINFELDKNRLPAPPPVVDKTRFDWDFADGTHAQGLINQHQFKNIGSYIIKIYADDGTTPKPQIIESVLLNIIPDKNYQLPQAKITINGKTIMDPLTDITSLDFKDSVNLDASQSGPKNLEYFWDFGDQNSGNGVLISHNYPQDLSQTFVVLRVKDSNGFLSDNFAEIQNSQNGKQAIPATASPQPTNPPKKSSLPITIIMIIIAMLALAMVRRFVRDRHHGKHQ